MIKLRYLILFLIFTFTAFSEPLKKDINFGDRLTMKVGNSDEKTLRDQLKDFYIESLNDNGKEIIVTFRGLENGKKTLLIGDKELEIDVKSNLKDDEKDIYLDMSDLSNRKLFLPKLPYLFFISILFLTSGLYLLFKKERKEIVINPEERFKKRMDSLTDEKWSFEISYALREYIDSNCFSSFLSGNYSPVDLIDEQDIEFIKNLDIMKFSGSSNNFISENRDTAVKKAWEIADKLRREVEENV